MLAHLEIIWQFHAHPVHQKVSRFFEPRYIGDDFFFGPNLVSFNRAVVPLFELSFLTKSQKLTSAQKQRFLSVCQKRFNKLKNNMRQVQPETLPKNSIFCPVYKISSPAYNIKNFTKNSILQQAGVDSLCIRPAFHRYNCSKNTKGKALYLVDGINFYEFSTVIKKTSTYTSQDVT